jgi:hypothetical protein
MPVIGYLGPGSAQSDAFRITGFRQGLKEAGYVEGQNLPIRNSFTTTESIKAGTLRPGNSRNCFRKRSARASDHCGHSGGQPRLVTDQMFAFGTKPTFLIAPAMSAFGKPRFAAVRCNWRIVHTSYGYA